MRAKCAPLNPGEISNLGHYQIALTQRDVDGASTYRLRGVQKLQSENEMSAQTLNLWVWNICGVGSTEAPGERSNQLKCCVRVQNGQACSGSGNNKCHLDLFISFFFFFFCAGESWRKHHANKQPLPSACRINTCVCVDGVDVARHADVSGFLSSGGKQESTQVKSYLDLRL